ncbi:MAG: isopentenyl-diphosphate Delta-isomerase [Coriobacteriia bacterium]|nr:isopentenyl-diphosphate Delta-isomerase [Coriobacteriia bacterium]MBN2840075.1 isopentenyl-diphosphate Delta-isomerase [Coriobacteriia bacterium]
MCMVQPVADWSRTSGPVAAVTDPDIATLGERATAGEAAWQFDEPVIAVDEDDNEIGEVSRAGAHNGAGILHRAFMTVLVDGEGRLLLARRSAFKRLWALAWADSCAGHPRPGEGVVEAAQRRIREELGCSAELQSVGSFIYQAELPGLGSENELCHLLVGRATSALDPDPAEVDEVAAFRLADLDLAIREDPDAFAPWLVESLREFPLCALSATETFE